jgi:hypothetical protein
MGEGGGMRTRGEAAVGSQRREGGRGRQRGGGERGERAACWRLGFRVALPGGWGGGVRWHVGWWEGVLAKLSRVVLVKVLFSLLRLEINFSVGAYC